MGLSDLDNSVSKNQVSWEATKNELDISKLTPEEIRNEVKSQVLLNNPMKEILVSIIQFNLIGFILFLNLI